jgi:Histidine kinase-, DNA gyrase B-, and HSP90-like ATPase
VPDENGPKTALSGPGVLAWHESHNSRSRSFCDPIQGKGLARGLFTAYNSTSIMPANGTDVAKGNPSKTFFISMLTRDISLVDCILDLLDNSVDGIGRSLRRRGVSGAAENKFEGYRVEIKFDGDAFVITDNCGGIPIEIARTYAFRFGKPDDAIHEIPHSIGLYGIGMKRAMFKMGRDIEVASSTGDESFRMKVNVDAWRSKDEEDWTFPLDQIKRGRTDLEAGTSVKVTSLYSNIRDEFGDPAFKNTLIRSAQRDYSFILQHRLSLSIAEMPVNGILPQFRESDEITPQEITTDLDGVHIEITAGLSAPPPEDDSAEAKFPDADVYGWYVVCNDRVVITADKTPLTGWGVGTVPSWHFQYFGFLGVVRFESDDPSKLPWKTTKRAVDENSVIYRKALLLMGDATKAFTDYTNKRKSELERARAAENAAVAVPITRVRKSATMRLPRVAYTQMKRICYDKPETEVKNVARALGLHGNYSAKEVGIKTFDYCKEHEVG